MRSFTDGNGADSSAAARAYLAGTSQPIIFTLVKIQIARYLDTVNAPFGGLITDSPFTKSFLLTDCPAAVTYTPLGTFKSAVVKHGAIPFAIGMDFAGFDVTWAPTSSDLVHAATGSGWFGSVPTMSALEAALDGYFYGAYVSVYKVVMPTFYDANTYGVCLLHRGAVDAVKIEGGQMTLTVGSIVDQQDRQIPAQLIGPNSRFASVDPMAYVGVSELSLGGGNADAVRWANFAAEPSYPQSRSLVTGLYITVTQVHTPPTGYFDGGFLIWTAGPLRGMRRPIARSTTDTGLLRVTFQLAKPFPYDAILYSAGFLFGFTFDAYALRNPQSTESSGTYDGFPNVPRPEDAI